METLYPRLILDALSNVRYPGNGKNIVELGMVEDDIRIDGNTVSFSLIFDKPTDPFVKSLVKAAETALTTYISPEVDVKDRIGVKFRNPNPAPRPDNPLKGVKNIIGVSSGKGWGRQVDRGKQSGRGPGTHGLQGGSARRRYFRTVGAQDVWCGGRAYICRECRRA